MVCRGRKPDVVDQLTVPRPARRAPRERFVSYVLWLSASAAVFHLAAPSAIGEMVPPRRWINFGIFVAVLMFMLLLLGYVFDALALD